MVDQSYYKKADEIIEHYERCAASLIPSYGISSEYRYLPAELLTYVAGQIGVTEAKAFSVATFARTFLLNRKENTLSRYAMAQLVM